ncbi:MAG: tripartite tricarboxylate transporter substrate binding protein [Proteobacteria bacterium]|nr:tripartite tricarboxylate transporter substrate binding protein [Pseudomonadota bacterium]
MSRYHSEILRWIVLIVVGVLANAVLSVPAGAADYPQKGKTIKILLGYAAGGASDTGARILAGGLEKELGTPVVVVNKPGASSQLAYTELFRSQPDGYTIGKVIFPGMIGSYLDPARKAVYTRQGFQPLALHVLDPGVFAVKADSPFRTMKDVIAAAKAAPEKVTITTTGLKTHEHFAVLMLQKAAGVKFAMVHFKGAAPAITAVLGGKIDVECDNVGDLLPHVKSGSMRILGVMDHQENQFLPGVKTLEAQGYKIYSAASRGFAAPKGTPKEIVEILSGAIKKVVATEDHKKKMADMGLTLRYMDQDQYAKYWEESEKLLAELLPLTQE